MKRIDEILEYARSRGFRPWIALKEELSWCVIRLLAARGGAAVLQGGAALHFAYGSPRLSADIDYVGADVGRVLEEHGETLARAAGDLLGCPARWSMHRAGHLVRGKITIELGPARLLALPVEAYEVQAHMKRTVPLLGWVEEPMEIAADKIVASADRLARRGTLKMTDLYDLWHLVVRVGAEPPPQSLVEAKLIDYGQRPMGADLSSAVHSMLPEEFRAVLDGVLPSDELDELDHRKILVIAADLLAGYQDVV